MRLFLVWVLLCVAAHAETVLVLPFFNHSKTANLDWLGESIAESVHDALVSEGLLALDREDRLEAYRRLNMRPGAELTHASIIKIGQSLDATKVVYGEFELLAPESGKEQTKGTLRINARIVDLKDMRQGPPFGELGALEDLASIEARVDWQALAQLIPKSVPPEQEYVKRQPPVRLDAVESYIRGLLATMPEQRYKLFTQSARLDEHYSQPCFQLGKIAWEQKDYKNAATWLARVAKTDSHYLEAQFFLGLSQYQQGMYPAAERDFQTVAASVPLNEVFNNLGAAQSRRGDTAGAIASFRKALEGDSGDPDYHFNLAYELWRAGEFDQAVESFRAALARNGADNEATSMLGLALKRQGPRANDPKSEGRERLKRNYDEAAYRQLQAELKK
jgi:tetratricopeptide (TPR) repeat protein